MRERERRERERERERERVRERGGLMDGARCPAKGGGVLHTCRFGSVLPFWWGEMVTSDEESGDLGRRTRLVK